LSQLWIGYACAEPEREVCEAVDDGACPGSGEAFAYAGFVGVTDAVDAGEAGSMDNGYGVADERAFAWLGVQGADWPG
jgi:hypothetical protein